MLNETALVVFSGGQDSTTCLLMALALYEKVEAISFDYGQKHKIELECAKNICKEFNVPLTIVKTDVFKQVGNSALLKDSKQDVNEVHNNDTKLPASFVPGRNVYFLTIASMFAYKKGIKKVITGVSQQDFSGYPDCREETIKSLQQTINLGMDYDITLVTPLINMSKSQEVEIMMGYEKGAKALSLSHTCYNGQFPPCGECPSCKLRAKAFREAGYPDPLIDRVESLTDKEIKKIQRACK